MNLPKCCGIFWWVLVNSPKTLNLVNPCESPKGESSQWWIHSKVNSVRVAFSGFSGGHVQKDGKRWTWRNVVATPREISCILMNPETQWTPVSPQRWIHSIVNSLEGELSHGCVQQWIWFSSGCFRSVMEMNSPKCRGVSWWILVNPGEFPKVNPRTSEFTPRWILSEWRSVVIYLLVAVLCNNCLKIRQEIEESNWIE